jgi:hypothetical protein
MRTATFRICFLGLLVATVIRAQEQPRLTDPSVGQKAQHSDTLVHKKPPVTALTVNDGTAGLLDLNGATSGYTGSGVFLQALTAGKPGVAAKIATADASSSFSVFNSADTNILCVNGLGRVGIGTCAPATDLHVISSSASASSRGPMFDYYSNDGNGNLITIRKARGTLAGPAAVLQGDIIGSLYTQVFDGTAWQAPARIKFTVDGPVSAGHVPTTIQFMTGDGTVILGGLERMRIDSSGNVGIGTTTPQYKLDVNGTIHATQVIGATYQDVAEWVPATQAMPPGTVVVLNLDRNNEVMPSARAYDTAVAGVVSTHPGVLLGVAAVSKSQIATTGRVRVKVDATKEPIKVGDLLVTSGRSGFAMKSIPLDLGGVKIHRPGTLIGKALEPLPSGEGDILVLLSLQ